MHAYNNIFIKGFSAIFKVICIKSGKERERKVNNHVLP